MDKTNTWGGDDGIADNINMAGNVLPQITVRAFVCSISSWCGGFYAYYHFWGIFAVLRKGVQVMDKMDDSEDYEVVRQIVSMLEDKDKKSQARIINIITIWLKLVINNKEIK